MSGVARIELEDGDLRFKVTFRAIPWDHVGLVSIDVNNTNYQGTKFWDMGMEWWVRVIQVLCQDLMVWGWPAEGGDIAPVTTD